MLNCDNRTWDYAFSWPLENKVLKSLFQLFSTHRNRAGFHVPTWLCFRVTKREKAVTAVHRYCVRAKMQSASRIEGFRVRIGKAALRNVFITHALLTLPKTLQTLHSADSSMCALPLTTTERIYDCTHCCKGNVRHWKLPKPEKNSKFYTNLFSSFSKKPFSKFSLMPLADF